MKSLLFLLLLIPLFSFSYFPIEVDKNHILYYPKGDKVLDRDYVPKNLVKMEDYWVLTLRPNKNEGMLRRDAVDDLREFQKYCFELSWKSVPVRSAYRTYSDQYVSHMNYKKHWSAAIPWTSEHQLWLAVDFGTNDYFLRDDYYPKLSRCLKENAYKFGFILSYNYWNPHYIYEPWHYRYVWKKYAKVVMDNWLEASPWVFLEDPWNYLDWERDRYLLKILERKRRSREIKEINEKGKFYWEKISKNNNLSVNDAALDFLKKSILYSLKKRDKEDFFIFSFAYKYLKYLWDQDFSQDDPAPLKGLSVWICTDCEKQIIID